MRHDLATLFASRADAALHAASLSPWDMREATHSERAHGRDEHCRLIAFTALNDYLDWPSVAPVCIIERTWHAAGKRTGQCVMLSPVCLLRLRMPHARLTLLRAHWGIENGLHYVKDVTLGEDRSPLHAGAGPIVMAMLRLRYHCTHPEAAVALCGLLPEHT